MATFFWVSKSHLFKFGRWAFENTKSYTQKCHKTLKDLKQNCKTLLFSNNIGKSRKKTLILPTSPISVLSLDHPGSNTPISDSLKTKNQEMNEDCFIFLSWWFYFLVCKTSVCIQHSYQMSSFCPTGDCTIKFCQVLS